MKVGDLLGSLEGVPEAFRWAATRIRELEANNVTLQKEAEDRKAVSKLMDSGLASDVNEAQDQLNDMRGSSPSDVVDRILSPAMDLGTAEVIPGSSGGNMSSTDALEELRNI